MARWWAGSALVLWVGVTLLLARVRWLTRPGLTARLEPYVLADHGAPARRPPAGGTGNLAAACLELGGRASRALGLGDDAADRLRRIHSPLDLAAFRVHQLGWALAGLAAGCVAGAALSPLPVLALAAVLVGPVAGFGVADRRLAAESRRWQRRVERELPVVVEQLAMLTSAGYSLGAALARLAERGHGNVSRDLVRVCGRIRQGLSEGDALREWAAVADVPAVDGLLPVLALNREATDLGRLLTVEARRIRRDLHRRLVESAERRAQLVWVPVTVAALVPGVAFLAVPFLDALRLYAAP